MLKRFTGYSCSREARLRATKRHLAIWYHTDSCHSTGERALPRFPDETRTDKTGMSKLWCLAFSPLCRFAPWLYHPLAFLPLSLFTPWLICPLDFSPLACSRPGSFALWLVRPLACSPPGSFAPWLFCPLACSPLSSFAPWQPVEMIVFLVIVLETILSWSVEYSQD